MAVIENKKFQRVLSFVLTLVMLVTCFPSSVIAETEEDTSEYIQVRTVEDLYNVRLDLTANYILMNDIDLTEATAEGGDWDFNGNGWNPIGSGDVYSNNAFSGIFDGNGHSIIGMRIDVTTVPSGTGDVYLGLFSNVSGTVKNLSFEGGSVYDAVGKDAKRYLGSVAGYTSGTILNCKNTMDVVKIGTWCNNGYLGGIAGYAKGNAVIEGCSNTGVVYANSSGRADRTDLFAGGIVGESIDGVVINGCYNTGKIESQSEVTRSSGGPRTAYSNGIAGGKAVISDCYNTGTITTKGEGGNYSFGIGATAKRCYNLGEVKGSSWRYAVSQGTSENCYYLKDTGNSNTGSTSLTSAQFLLTSMFVGFDFESVWMQNTDAAYPYPQLRSNVQDDRILTDYKIYSDPKKTIYISGESLDVTGMVLLFNFSNADPEYVTVTNDMAFGYDLMVTGIQTISVIYYGKTFAFDVTVIDKPFVEIYDVKDLYDIRLDLTGNYILMNDIDLTEATAEGGAWDFDGRGWNPIGSNDIYSSGEFSGIFDGNGFAIKGMRIKASDFPSGTGDKICAGLFAVVTGEIRNLTMSDVDIYAYGATSTGSIAAYNYGSIINCSVSGLVSLCTSVYTGGVVGYNNGLIKNCYNNATVKCLNDSIVGGITGYNQNIISDCYNTGNVEDTSYRAGTRVGGIAGYNDLNAKIMQCYNIGIVTHYSDKNFAIAYDYSGKGILNCYYLAETGVGSNNTTALTDEQMRLVTMFTGFDFDEVWTINGYANYPYPQLQSNIQDMNETVTLIRVIAYPAKMKYLTGDTLNTVGGLFEAVYISGKTELISITSDMITGYDPALIGTQTLTVTYGGQTDTFDITVNRRPEPTSVTIIAEPDVKEFVVGTELDFAGAKVKVEYDDNSSAEFDVTVDMTTGADINHMGTQTVTVTFGEYSDTFEIKVVPASISGISISKLPDKVVYLKGEKINLTGLVIVADYNNGREVEVSSGYTVSGYDATKLGTQTLTVDFAGKTATFEVTVTERTVTNIQIQSKPVKLEYFEGEDLELKGLVVVAAYADGGVEIIDDYTVSGFDGKAGIKVITVSRGGKSASFTVKISVITVEKLAITRLPVKLEYIENEAFSSTGLVVEATYNNGKTEAVTDYEIIGFSSLPGTHTIYVTLGGQTDSFDITVSEKVLSDVQVKLPAKTLYQLGEAFDSTGMEVIAYYNNGQSFSIDSYEMTGFDSTTAGAKEVFVSYGDFTRSFVVVVSEKSNIETTGAVKVGTVVGRLGETVEIPVTITKNTGLSAFCHTITFDYTAIKFVSVSAVNGFANGTVIVNDENVTNGEITLLWFQPTDVVESGVAYILNFEILETAKDGISAINIDFADNENGNASGENVIFEPVNGSVEVLSYWLGDLDGNRKYEMVDLLKLAQYVSGMQMTLTDKQELSADVNEDGTIDIHDVTLLSQWLLVADM